MALTTTTIAGPEPLTQVIISDLCTQYDRNPNHIQYTIIDFCLRFVSQFARYDEDTRLWGWVPAYGKLKATSSDAEMKNKGKAVPSVPVFDGLCWSCDADKNTTMKPQTPSMTPPSRKAPWNLHFPLLVFRRRTRSYRTRRQVKTWMLPGAIFTFHLYQTHSQLGALYIHRSRHQSSPLPQICVLKHTAKLIRPRPRMGEIEKHSNE